MVHSPVCRPTRTWTAKRLPASVSAEAQRIARAGPSNAATNWPSVAGERPAAEPLALAGGMIEKMADGHAVHARVQDRREHAIERRPRARAGGAGHEPLDLVDERILIADKRQVVLAGQLDEERAGDPAGDVAAFLDLSR